MSSQWGEFRLAWEAWLKRPGGAPPGSLLVKLAAFDVVSVHYLPRMALNLPGGLRKHHCLTSDLQKRQEVKSGCRSVYCPHRALEGPSAASGARPPHEP